MAKLNTYEQYIFLIFLKVKIDHSCCKSVKKLSLTAVLLNLALVC